MSDKTEKRFSGQGNQRAGYKPSDLVIKFEQVMHPRFKRSGHNLILTQTISLVDVLQGTPINFKSVDGRTCVIAVDELITPKTCKVVPNEGMPTGDGACGNLYVKFNIEFPAIMDSTCTQTIITALKANAEELS